MKSASEDNMTDPDIGCLVYKPTARADVLKGTRLPLRLKALLSAGTDEQGMRIQKTRWNDLILPREFLPRNFRQSGSSPPLPHHNPSLTLNRT